MERRRPPTGAAPLVSQPKISARLELYDELSRCLQQNDENRAIELINQLLSSGTPSDKILGHLRHSISDCQGEAAKSGQATQRCRRIKEISRPSRRSGSADNSGGAH